MNPDLTERIEITMDHVLAVVAVSDFDTSHDWYPGDKNLVFTAPEGRPLDLRVFRRRFWYPAVRDSVGEPMRPHDYADLRVMPIWV